MEKKYYSENEFFTVDKHTKEVIPYTGYVLIKDGKPFNYFNGEELKVGDNYLSKTNLSNEFFDRLLDKDLKLPKSLDECTFAANDFIKSSVIHKIIMNLEENNNYIFKNCIIAKNNLPLSDKIPVISPKRNYELKADGTYDIDNPGEVSGWMWSNISYNSINSINNKENWPDEIPGKDINTNDIVDAVIIHTNKKVTNEDNIANNDGNLFAVFVAFKNKIKLLNLYPFDTSLLKTGQDPFKCSQEKEFVDLELSERTFIEHSPVNDIVDANSSNISLLEFSNFDPEDKDSVTFKNITSIALDGDYLYVTDSVLNGVFQYDVSKCLSDRGAASNKITLVEYFQGKGSLNEPYCFNSPSSISVFDNTVAVLDKGNKVIKIYDSYLNHKFILKHGIFGRQNASAVGICPYDFILEGQIIKKGAYFVICDTGSNITIDIFDNTTKYIGNYHINYIGLLDEQWINPNTGNISSTSDPIHSKETIKKVLFSYNNSNFYYIVTDRRIIKLQLSQLTYPIGVVSYGFRAEVTDGLIWETTMQPWNSVQDLDNNLAIWEYARAKMAAEYPINKCYALTGIPDEDCDVIFNVIDNVKLYTDGKLQRWDNNIDKKLLYIDNITKKYTYEHRTEGKNNLPVEVKTNTLIDEYIMDEATGQPVKSANKFSINGATVIGKKIPAGILFYKEPNLFKSTLIKNELHLYTNEELNFLNNSEYFNQVTFNKILYKLFFNLLEIKKYIFGRFVGGYSMDNIITYDHIEPDNSISELTENKENFFIGENEQTSIILNRCFINLYNVQVNILKKMQTKFASSINYNFNSYTII